MLDYDFEKLLRTPSDTILGDKPQTVAEAFATGSRTRTPGRLRKVADVFAKSGDIVGFDDDEQDDAVDESAPLQDQLAAAYRQRDKHLECYPDSADAVRAWREKHTDPADRERDDASIGRELAAAHRERGNDLVQTIARLETALAEQSRSDAQQREVAERRANLSPESVQRLKDGVSVAQAELERIESRAEEFADRYPGSSNDSAVERRRAEIAEAHNRASYAAVEARRIAAYFGVKV